MTPATRGAFAIAMLCSFAACRQSLPEESSSEAKGPGGGIMRIVFALPGDDIGAAEYREIMERIRGGVGAAGAGEVAGFGFGMGTMEISVWLEGEDSEEKIERIVREVYPEAKFRVEMTRSSGEAPVRPGGGG